MATAKKKANRIVDKKKRALKNDLARTNKQRDTELKKADNLYRDGRQDVNFIYREVADYIKNLNAKTNKRFDEYADFTRSAHNKLSKEMGKTTNTNRANMLAELQRLGVQAAGTGDFDRDVNFAQMVAAQNRDNSIGNNSASRRNFNNLGAMIAASNAGSRGSAIGQLANTRNRSHTDIREKASLERMRIQELLREAELEREELIEQFKAQAAASRGYSGGGGRRYYSYGGGGGGYSRGGYSSGGGNRYENNVKSQMNILENMYGKPKPKAPPKPVRPTVASPRSLSLMNKLKVF